MRSLIIFSIIIYFILNLVGILFFEVPKVNLGKSFCEPFDSFQNPLGCDQLGRDIFSLLCYGNFSTAILSIPSRFITILLASVVSFLASSSNYLKIMFFDPVSSVFNSIPSLLIAMIILQLFPSDTVFLVFFSIALSDWAFVYENLISKINEIQKKGFVKGSYLMGGDKLYIFKNHLLPELYHMIRVLFLTGIPNVIMTLSLFSFLGFNLGKKIFGPGLGEQINFSKDYYNQSNLSVLVPIAGIISLIYVSNNLKYFFKSKE